MLGLGILAITAGAAAWITLIILLSILGVLAFLYVGFTIGIYVYGLEFIGFLYNWIRIILILAMAFGAIFLTVLGIGVLS